MLKFWFLLIAVWFFTGLIRFLPMKLRILERLGSKTTHKELVRRAKNGDKEIIKFLKISKIYIIIGIFLVCGMTLSIK